MVSLLIFGMFARYREIALIFFQCLISQFLPYQIKSEVMPKSGHRPIIEQIINAGKYFQYVILFMAMLSATWNASHHPETTDIRLREFSAGGN